MQLVVNISAASHFEQSQQVADLQQQSPWAAMSCAESAQAMWLPGWVHLRPTKECGMQKRWILEQAWRICFVTGSCFCHANATASGCLLASFFSMRSSDRWLGGSSARIRACFRICSFRGWTRGAKALGGIRSSFSTTFHPKSWNQILLTRLRHYQIRRQNHCQNA